MASITYPNGKVLTYNYGSGLDDSISRLTSLSDTSGTLESYSYLGQGTVVKRARPLPNVDLTYIGTPGDGGDQYAGLDRFGRVIEQKWYNNTTATTTDDFKYGYDRNSNRLYRTNEVNHSFDELYHANGSTNGYDNLNQLQAFARGTLNSSHDTISSPSHSINYSLDAVGNFSSTTTDGGSAVNRTHNKQNEVTGVGSSTLTFDAKGNLTKDDAGQQYVFDAWNRLVAVKNSSNVTIVSYKYDGLSRRIVENPGTARDLYYSAAWQVLEERLGGVSTASVQYVWSPVYIDALILRDRSTLNNGTLDERLWVQQDANYNVTALINGSGAVVERYVYDPFGKQTVLDASFNTRSSSSYAFVIGFQGARLDTISGLYHERFRDLHPGLGRWIQADPLGFGAGDTNLYRFVGNQPANASDAFGLEPPGYGHMYPLYLGGSPDQILFELTEEQHTAMHDYFREKGFRNTDAGKAAWGKLTDAQRKAIVKEGMRRAGIPSHYIDKYLDDVMKGAEPGVSKSPLRKGPTKRDISRAVLDQQRKIAGRCGKKFSLPRGGSINLRTLAVLGAEAISVGAVTYGYGMYLDRGEELLQAKLEETIIAIDAAVLRINLAMLHFDGLLPLSDFVATIGGERVHFE